MLNVGLTGGIGAGKSEVARRFADLGAVLVDSDVLAREVVATATPGLAAVVAAFGPQVLGPDGALDRESLAALVFPDSDARSRLEAIIHPLVRARSAEVVAAAAAADPRVIVVHDVPLLAESGLAGQFDAVVVVVAELSVRLHRLVAGRGMTEADARARIAAQASDAERAAVATHIIHNDASLADLDRAVLGVWTTLQPEGLATR